MINRKLKRWLLIGVSEIVLSLTLIAIAPTFLNSKKPEFGFLIWITVPTVLSGSSIYALGKFAAARKARNIFVQAFPEYSYLGVSEFLELSPAHVASQINLLRSAKETSEVQEFNISLFEILEQTKHEKI
ncbi:hypothetical protein IQ255_17565 [Pleurocapsales cyanobacterium LEGE 10410]|nr:hypothetical protein [Pleurocapsales cyanobacterium LEGE 10410]